MTRENPHSTGLIVMLGAAAVAIYGYTQGWFTSLTTVPVTTPATGATQTSNPITNPATQIVNAPSSSVPPLGTIVNNGNDIAAQAAAHLAYINPSAAAVSQAPSGYTMVHVSDMSAAPSGVIYLRNDIAQKDLATANAVINAANQVAQVMAATSGQPYVAQGLLSLSDGSFKLANLQSGVSGLAGLGYYNPYGYRN